MAKTSGGIIKRAKTTRKNIQDFVGLWFKLRYYYGWHYKYSKVDEHVILFESFHGKNVSDSPLYMLREFVKDPRSRDFTIYYASSKENVRQHAELMRELGLDVRLVCIESRKYAQVMATAKYLVNNSSFPAYFTRRPEQRYIQTWHGTPLKTLGRQMRQGVESMYNVQHNFLQANVLTFPNEYTRDIFMRDYNLEDIYTGQAALVGYPRNQVFFEPEKARAIRDYYGLDDFETFAYMPTWRGANNYTVNVDEYRNEILSFFQVLDSCMRDDQLMFVNFHSMVADSFGEFEFDHILPFPTNKDNYEFLSAMDALITDYSSVFFDYSLTRKPVILFDYDREIYLAERGMYMELDDLPFLQAHTIEELAEYIVSGSYRDHDYSGTSYEAEFLAYDSAENSRKALDLLFEVKREDIPIKDFADNIGRVWNVIEPCRQSTLEDIETTCQVAVKESDLVVFHRSSFNKDKSILLHDEHPELRNYLFITKAYNCTVLEELMMERSERIRDKVMQRELQRVLPNLVAPASFEETLFIGEVGSSVIYSVDDFTRLHAKPRYSKGGVLSIDVKHSGYELNNLMLVRGRTIAVAIPLSHEERMSGRICQAFSQAIAECDFEELDVLQVYIDGVEMETGQRVPIALNVANPDDLSGDDDDLAFTYQPMCVAAEDALEDLAIVPHANKYGFFALSCTPASVLFERFKNAVLISVVNDGGLATVRLKIRDGQFMVQDLVLKYRSLTESQEISLPYTLTVKGEWLIMESTFDPAKLPLRDVYWDAFVAIWYRGHRGLVPIVMSPQQVTMLKVKNQQWRIGEDKVFFTHIMRRSGLSFIFRDYYPKLDTNAARAKELAAFVTFFALHPYWKRKRVWLVYEKFCSLAQDNAFYFFEYCMSLPEEERKHIYYVIDKTKPDFENVRPYGAQVIDFMSFKHILYTMVAKLYIASDSRTHLYVWRNKPSLVRTRISKHKIFFLQHGVTALKQVAYLFGRKGSSPMTYFLTTSQREQEIVVDNFEYRVTNAPILGFSRWDVLKDRSSLEHPSVLLMPTWRPWLEEQTSDVFVNSDYFKAYSSFIQSPALHEVLEKYDMTLRFFIHPKLSEQLENFIASNDRIQLVAQGSEPLNQVMMECNMLVTDYSSVCWDMLYMDKPVVFYQFDQDVYENVVGSYVNLNEDLPGDVCLDEQQAIQAIERCAQRGFVMTQEDVAKADGWFAWKDENNRQRTYDFIVGQGF